MTSCGRVAAKEIVRADKHRTWCSSAHRRLGRQSRTECLAARKADAGALVREDIILDLVNERITHWGCANGFLVDGFPRTLPQADAMKAANVRLDVVLEIDVPDSAIIDRMSGRRVHQPSGRTYHIAFNPPKVAGKDDVTGEDLVQRVDDTEATVRHRLDVYQQQTRPLVGYYTVWAATGAIDAPRYRKIDGTGSVEAITQREFAALAG